MSKYMIGFLLGDFVVRAMGLSYNGKDSKGRHQWNRLVAGDV
jgi:hypothetical protein